MQLALLLPGCNVATLAVSSLAIFDERSMCACSARLVLPLLPHLRIPHYSLAKSLRSARAGLSLVLLMVAGPPVLAAEPSGPAEPGAKVLAKGHDRALPVLAHPTPKSGRSPPAVRAVLGACDVREVDGGLRLVVARGCDGDLGAALREAVQAAESPSAQRQVPVACGINPDPVRCTGMRASQSKLKRLYHLADRR